MDSYKDFLEIIKTEYTEEKVLKNSERGSVCIVRNKESKEHFIFRTFEGNADVYRKLLGTSCRNLPKILKVEEENGKIAVLEEYIKGDTLFYLLKGAVFSEEEAEKITVQLCRALDFLHGLGIVHRDIKPENIVIRGSEAVLIDFDASRNITPGKSNDTQILGTTGYAAPEQYGLSQTDARADIYSLGVVLNIMLTGEHPSIKLATGRLGKIVQHCTMISPEKRYQSAEEIIKELEKENKKPKKIFKMVAALILCAAISVFVFAEDKKQEQELETEKEPEYEVLDEIIKVAGYEEKDPLSGWTEGTGKSDLLPKDFYEYWNADEIIEAERIFLDAPGNIEDYLI